MKKYCIESPFEVEISKYINEKHIEALTDIDETDICDYLYDEYDVSGDLWDGIYDAYDKIKDCKGSFNLEEAENRILSFAKSFFDDNKDSFVFCVKVKDEQNNVIEERQFSYFSILMRMLDVDFEDSSFYSRVGAYVESSLSSFLKESQWHSGFVGEDGSVIPSSDQVKCQEILKNCESYYPVVWFGTDANVLEKKWAFGLKKEDYSPYNICGDISYLVDDSNESFEIWYNAECAFWAPDYNEDVPKCPVEISEEDSEEIIREKINAYIISSLQ